MSVVHTPRGSQRASRHYCACTRLPVLDLISYELHREVARVENRERYDAIESAPVLVAEYCAKLVYKGSQSSVKMSPKDKEQSTLLALRWPRAVFRL